MCLERLRICVMDIQEWFKTNRLVMNDDKTEYIPFIPKQYDALVATSSIWVEVDSIPASISVTYLGVVLDRHYITELVWILDFKQILLFIYLYNVTAGFKNYTVLYLQITTD